MWPTVVHVIKTHQYVILASRASISTTKTNANSVMNKAVQDVTLQVNVWNVKAPSASTTVVASAA